MHDPSAKLKSVGFTENKRRSLSDQVYPRAQKGPPDIPQWYRERQLDLLDAIEELGAHQKDTNY